MRHPYTQGLFRSIPLPGADKNKRPLIAIPGQLPLPHERPRGCNFGPRCSYFRDGVCNADEIPMIPVRNESGHASRCLRIEEIDWNAGPQVKARAGKSAPGGVVLDIEHMKKYYSVSANAIFGGGDVRTVKANEDVTIEAREAETVALVGESGCGKSTLAKVLLGLETKTSGAVKLSGVEIGETETTERDQKTLRSIQMVFQNPFDTLNPSMRVGDQIVRVLEKFGVGKTDEERRARMLELLDLVKLPREFERRMPRQLSGGQKQRIGIARAFAGNPEVVVADEPVSALDVSVQAAVTELLMDIQRDRRTTMLFISHDLSIVRYLADRVVVMYLGHVVETGPTETLFAPPYHPYTEALLSAVPIADTSIVKKHIVLDGDIPSAVNPPPGCPFQTRCRWKHRVPGNRCETEVPVLKEISPQNFAKCHLSAEVLAEMEPVISQAKPDRPAGKAEASAPAALLDKPKAKPARKTPAAKPVKAAPVKVAPAKTTRAAAAKPAPKEKLPAGRPAGIAKPKKPDDLKMISGVGPKIEKILHGLGIYTYAQVASWKKAERDWVDDHLKFSGRIEREDWVKQAKALARGGEAEYVKVFGKKPR
jgi:peptide/nickel transport system ATP-binding protein